MGLSRKFNFLWNFQSKNVNFLFEAEFYVKKYSFEVYSDNVAKKLEIWKGAIIGSVAYGGPSQSFRFWAAPSLCTSKDPFFI